MIIGITGASGKLARAVVRELAHRAPQHTIVPISRTPEGQGRRGDFDRPETLVSAFVGLDRLLVIPSAELHPGVIGAQLVAACDAALAARVGHVVLVSSVKALARTPSALAESYRRGEEAAQHAARWTILRMGFFIETLTEEARRDGTLFALGENDVAFVSRDDVAAAAAGVLVGEGHVGATYELSGPRPYSGAARAEALSVATGHAVRFVVIGEPELRSRLAALPPFLVDELVAMQASFVAGDYARVTDDVTRLAGRSPRGI